MLMKILTIFVIFLKITCPFYFVSADDNVIATSNGQRGTQHGIALQTPAGQIHVKVNAHGELVSHEGIPSEVINALQNVVWNLVLQGKLPIEGGADKVPSKFKNNTPPPASDWQVINNFVSEHVQKFQNKKKQNQLPLNGEMFSIDEAGSPQTFNPGASLGSNTVNLPLTMPDGMERVQVPMYFKTVPLSSARVLAEVDYYMKHNHVWSQRVVLEILYYDILGEYANASMRNDNYVMTLKLQGREQHYIPKFILTNWITNDDICTWEGITCHNIDILEQDGGLNKSDTNNSKPKVRESTRCWCIRKEEIEEWTWRDDLEQDGQDCDCPPDQLPKLKPPLNAVTKIELPGFNLVGGRLSAPFHHLPYLTHLNLSGNMFITHIPSEFGLLSGLHVLDLSHNDILGPIPSEIYQLRENLQEIKILNAGLEGMIPDFLYNMDLIHLDLGENKFHGSISNKVSLLSNLQFLHLGENTLSGTIPKQITTLHKLEFLHLGQNHLHGTIPNNIGRSYSEMCQLILGPNELTGVFPQDVFKMKKLRYFDIQKNKLDGEVVGDWSVFSDISVINLSSNEFEGTLPMNLFVRGLKELDVSDNFFAGTLPNADQSNLSEITLFDFSNNDLTGTLPSWLSEMKSLTTLGITKNRMTGDIDDRLCFYTENAYSSLIQCTDFVACPPTYVHPEGAASMMMGCSRCQACIDNESEKPPTCNYLGQSKCNDENHFDLYGDMDGDGNLTQREILRLLYVKTGGKNWGTLFKSWADMSVEKCQLAGINCKEGRVTKIDLRGANFCQKKDGNCNSLPSEIGLLGESLEVLDLSTSLEQKKVLDIPSEIGLLTNLKILDLSRNRLRSVPPELGFCTQLVILGLAQVQVDSVPSSIWSMTKLEKLDLSQNSLKATTIPTNIGTLTSLRELFISRSHMRGKIPSELGNLTMLKNLELYGNVLTGSLPSTLSNLTDLKRIDLFNNKLTGDIDVLMEIKNLEILHLKANALSATLPNEIGSLAKLSWLDITKNRFKGQLPSSLADLNALRDFKIGGNLFQPPIPIKICQSKNINKGFASEISCGAIVCPLGTVSASGHASTEDDCMRCPVGKTSLYLGSAICKPVSEFDFLELLYNAMNGDEWSQEMKDKWEMNNRNPCNWDVVECDESGQIESLEIPVSGIEYNEQLQESRMSGY